ncbi:MAG: PilT/PilU family type 4a pilus ATPase [Bdellovibrionales bacterium]|nr:PilT/PilU family type 4a pilus ATPase [Bdellovibrionales bacterium]
MEHTFNEILTQAAAVNASDIHLKVGVVPVIRRFGLLKPLYPSKKPLSAEDMEELITQALTPDEVADLVTEKEIDKGYEIPDVGRFRMNIFRQRGTTRFVVRFITKQVPALDSLALPHVVKTLAESERGLVLVTGVTGCGKSTTLASMINHINQTANKHIITLEDPIEYYIKDRKSIISQRELGIDMNSFANSLRATLRQDPDVIFVGEMRDRETIETALIAAETGHLVFSTLHTLDSRETINRILSQFPSEQQGQIRRQLANVLRAVISQRLIMRKDGNGLVPACEILVNNQRIKEMIEDPERSNQILDAIETSAKETGMRSFDQSLIHLVLDGHVSLEEALKYTSQTENFKLKVKGIQSGVDSDWDENIEAKSKVEMKWDDHDDLSLDEGYVQKPKK